MLVITRKLGEKIQIGNATITVTRTGKCNVVIGVEAPNHVRIQRAGPSSATTQSRELSRDSANNDSLSKAS
ncbi:carbon storage regulator [Schlesneria paludicola]|uniref:carbon storage regulator n=1 Tax=Schlesneria paludicola TaxID=360056 RepID=UPI00029A3CD6|nr:carbon storage regulator [Schlesneria paludicola]